MKAIELGNFPETAAQAAGIERATFYDWLKKKPEFLTRIRLAEARSEMMLEGVILKAAHSKGEWNAAKYIMGRRFRHRWAEDAPIQIESTGSLVVNSGDGKNAFEL